MQSIKTGRLTKIQPIAEATYLLRLDIREAANFAPGQFLQIWCADDWPLFDPNKQPSRPFAILGREATKNELSLLIRDRGKHSHWLTSRQAGEEVRFYGPLGQGFSFEAAEQAHRVLLVAEAIGIVPLIELARCLLEAGKQVTLLATASPNRAIPLETLLDAKNLDYRLEITENSPERLAELLPRPEYQSFEAAYFSLAPRTYPAVLKAGIFNPESVSFANPEIYLQKTLPCGIGACGQCQIATKTGEKLVCSDGPVFPLNEISWQLS